jgi:sugar lactone lactonase YvrE
MSRVADSRACELGEGPLWHPQRQELYWFDIPGKRMLSEQGGAWSFDTFVSAAGWIDDDTLLIASARALLRFDLPSGTSEELVLLEADNPVTRSNDGRADPWGGFWIGTMGIRAKTGAGAIYRFWRGEVRQLYPDITIPNAICFSPDQKWAYFTDTPTRQIQRQALDPETGWPVGDPELHIDLRDAGRNPDGAVVDAAGNLWCAEWGSGHVACYDPQGRLSQRVVFDAPHTSCPAFGGPDLTRLYCTTAREGLDTRGLAAHPLSGQLFHAEGYGPGQPEHRVIL